MKLIDIIETFISGDWGSEQSSHDSSYKVYCVRGADIEPIYKNDYNQIPQRYISERSALSRTLKAGDIVVEKSGGSPVQSTGRVCLITKELIEEKGNLVCSNFCAAFRVKKDWDSEYVYLFLQNVYNAGVFFNFEGKTSGIKNLQLEQAFQAIEIEPLAIAKQKENASIIRLLDKKIGINRAINQNLAA